ncbi:hypothetical protein BJY04DRAFT_213656 [Aspergillus karnatakaensis]|uniref:DUF3176 domain-containing protein n=1 Tax=Aspergillus karnatakaensis TaxID=1810916 RepID=UPI003CCDB0BB
MYNHGHSRSDSHPDGHRESSLPESSLLASLPSTRPASPQPLTEKSTKSRHWHIQDSWFWEWLSLAFVNACFIAICIVLLIFDDKARPQITFNLSLNAIISVLSVACRSSLFLVMAEAISQLKWLWVRTKPSTRLQTLETFDHASRGPLGSLYMIFAHKGLSLASLGAMVVVLLLAFDPFLQQVLSYPTRSYGINVNETGTFSTAADASDATVRQATMGLFVDSPDKQFLNDEKLADEDNMRLFEAYYRAIWTDDLGIKPTCSTGNCTWPVFQSLGYCATCVDMTAEAELMCERPDPPVVPEGLEIFQAGSGDCAVVLPKGRPSNTTLTVTYDAESGSGDDDEDQEQKATAIKFPTDIVWKVHDTFLAGEPGVFNQDAGENEDLMFAGDVQRPSLVLAYARLGLDLEDPSTDDPVSGIKIEEVTQCSLSFCLRDYEVAVRNGGVEVSMLATDLGRVYKRSFEHQLAGGESESTCWAPQGGSQPALKSNSPADSRFEICTWTPLDDYPFVGRREQAYTKSTNNGWTRVDRNSRWEIGGTHRIVQTGLEPFMEKLAASLSALAMEDSDATVSGTVYDTEVYVEVQWLWIVFPGALVLLANLFLAVTILLNRRGRMPLWKSSTLALLYHGLERIEQDERWYETASGMEQKASGVDVRLERGGEDERLRLMKV